MFRNDEKMLNAVTGEALLSLLEDGADVSTETLRAQLKRMCEAETDDVRRHALNGAIRQTGRSVSCAGSTFRPENGSGREEQFP